jgi:hypothetical protein
VGSTPARRLNILLLPPPHSTPSLRSVAQGRLPFACHRCKPANLRVDQGSPRRKSMYKIPAEPLRFPRLGNLSKPLKPAPIGQFGLAIPIFELKEVYQLS